MFDAAIFFTWLFRFIEFRLANGANNKSKFSRFRPEKNELIYLLLSVIIRNIFQRAPLQNGPVLS